MIFLFNVAVKDGACSGVGHESYNVGLLPPQFKRAPRCPLGQLEGRSGRWILNSRGVLKFHLIQRYHLILTLAPGHI